MDRRRTPKTIVSVADFKLGQLPYISSMRKKGHRPRILLPSEHYTRIPNYVFEEELHQLDEPRGAAVYLFLIDWATHSGTVSATRAEIARALRMDERVVKACLFELSSRRFIKLRRKGVSRSHITKDVWFVPAVQCDSIEGWTPIPRFVITEYIPAYPKAVLLPILIYHQHMKWLNWSWVQAPGLSKLLNWSKNRIHEALRTMFTETEWRRLKTSLPRPLDVLVTKRAKPIPGLYSQSIRHHRVLAVQYTTQQTESIRSIFIPAAFRQRFKIKLTDEMQSALSSIFRSKDQHLDS